MTQICQACGQAKCPPECVNAWALTPKPERILSVLRMLGGQADNRQVAEMADSGPPGDVAAILGRLYRRGVVIKVGFGKSVNGTRPPSIWRLASAVNAPSVSNVTAVIPHPLSKKDSVSTAMKAGEDKKV